MLNRNRHLRQEQPSTWAALQASQLLFGLGAAAITYAIGRAVGGVVG